MQPRAIAGLAILCIVGVVILFSVIDFTVHTVKRIRRQRRCWHHDATYGTSWVKGELINNGTQKVFTCQNCKRMW